ncbi:HAD-IIB family hydrolase [Listeria innocua]|uniref:HAD-IIB family hydrolase n=1 Tax=Listeria innocua TaxID=1642 RepID=UPI00162839DE|nr:HAD-IIB family hydrolase [Listeria innocua]MBC1385546.1 HAD-IIB family hydrolase [Listeria innocua]
MENIIFVSDLDNTIFKSSEMKIDEKIVKLIDTIESVGGVFCICSGRSLNEVEDILKKYLPQKKVIIVGSGGSELLIENEYILLSYYCMAETKKIIQKLSNYFLINLYTSKQKYTYFPSETKEYLAEIISRTFYDQPQISDNLEFYMYNFMIRYCHQPYNFDNNDKILKIEIVGNEFFITPDINDFINQNELSCNKTSKYTFDLLNNNVNKITGVSKLKSMMSRNKLWVMGDYYNDVCLFKEADKSFVEVDAPEEIKKIATNLFQYGTWTSIFEELKGLKK